MPANNQPLGQRLQEARASRDILLMTHLVMGYPSFETNREVIRQMVDNGVDVIELQIPFSEPVADGPMILKANQEAINSGVTVAQCLDFAAEMAREHEIPFLFMTYYNILFKYGVDDFITRARDIGIQGCIIPDLPPGRRGALPGTDGGGRAGPDPDLCPHLDPGADALSRRPWPRVHLLRGPTWGHRQTDRLQR